MTSLGPIYEIGKIHVQGKVGTQVRTGTPTDGDGTDGLINLDPNASITDNLDALNEAALALGGRDLLLSSAANVAYDGNPNLAAARACGAAGVIGYTVKFCDPYLARMPMVREEFKKAGMPFLLLEGDCTLRSIGQQRTRIEAFIEMLYRLS